MRVRSPLTLLFEDESPLPLSGQSPKFVSIVTSFLSEPFEGTSGASRGLWSVRRTSCLYGNGGSCGV